MLVKRSASSTQSAGESDLNLASVTEFELANGLGGLFIDMPNCPAFSFDFILRSGDYLCPKDQLDLAHFLEHLVLMANESYPSHDEFSRVLQANGGSYNAKTGPINICYEFDAPDSNWSRMIDLAILAISKPLFLPEEFSNEKKVVRNEHQLCFDDPELKISRTISRAIGFPSVHPQDRLDSLDSISVDNVRDYYRASHNLASSRLIFAGHLPPSRRQLIKQKLAAIELPLGDRPALPRQKLGGAGLIYDEKLNNKTVAYDLALAVDDSFLDPADGVALGLIGQLFFHGDHSWIFGRGRKMGLIYGSYYYFDTFGPSSQFSICGQVRPESLKPLLNLMIEAIDRLLAGDLTVTEFDYQRDALIGSSLMYYLTPRSLINYFAESYANHNLIAPINYGQLVATVNQERLADVADRLFGSFDWTLGLLGQVSASDQKQIKDQFNQQRQKGQIIPKGV